MTTYTSPPIGVGKSYAAPGTQGPAGPLGSPELVVFSMTGTPDGSHLPAKTDTGQTITWFDFNRFTSAYTFPNGRGAFWCDLGYASYASVSLSKPVTWGEVEFAFMTGGGGDDGTVCIAVTDVVINADTSQMSMPIHFWTTPTNWAMTIWEKGSGQRILAGGAYATPLGAADINSVANRKHSMAFAIRGDSILFRAADEVVRRVTDPAIAALSPTAKHVFCESYMPNTNDDVPLVHGMTAGSDPIPPTLLTA